MPNNDTWIKDNFTQFLSYEMHFGRIIDGIISAKSHCENSLEY